MASKINIELVDKLSYLAGFLEADGCITIGNTGASMRVANKHVPTLERFSDWFGGTVTEKVSPSGCYDWRIHGPESLSLAEQLLPYLFMKRGEAEVFIRFQKTIGPRGRKTTPELLDYRRQLREELKQCRKSR